ncbi:ATP-binding protein, partial [Candidatus Desantisbacteria bacterium]|nr:ATP-binding protein [Candidatus Desantisbacteria bacterium]
NLLLNDQFFKYSKQPSILRYEVEKKIKTKEIETVFIDEIQRIQSLLNEVQYLIDNHKIKFILTGSSCRKLRRGGANLLGGRAVQRFLFPFIWNEVKEFMDLTEILDFGSLPHIFNQKNITDKKDALKSYCDIYLREEIQAESIVRNLGSFSRFLDMAASQFGEIISFSNIARECQLPVMTVKSYYEVLEDTLLGFRLEPWRKSIRKRLAAHPKFYLFDNGVTNAINKYLSSVSDPYLQGRLFEQFIIQETYRSLVYFMSETQMFFWQTNTGAEVDILLVKNKIVIAAIEIKKSKTIAGAHLSGLRSFKTENKNVPCYVVCNCDEPYTLEDVEIINWQDYLQTVLNKYIS